MKKILLVFGTRPEAIKMAPLVNEFKKHPDKFETIVCVTGQHRQMLDQVLALFEIKPDYDLNIMKAKQDLFDITSNVLLGLRDVFDKSNPNYVFVHGDTATSTAAALAAFYRRISVVHIEAGLRTYNMYSPYPEEINRQITSRLTSYHIAPTELSKQNLLNENINADNIFITGNTVIDALHSVVFKLNNDLTIREQAKLKLKESGYDLDRLTDERKLVLITGHRRENFGGGFIQICEAIKELSMQFADVDFVYPMHLNPNVREPINNVFGDFENYDNLFFIEPLDYLPFVYLMSSSYVILTDSGGIQEEAPGLGKPVLVMRDTTERPEAVNSGTVKLVGANKERIIEEMTLLLTDKDAYRLMSNAKNPYGDGEASKKIVDIISNI